MPSNPQLSFAVALVLVLVLVLSGASISLRGADGLKVAWLGQSSIIMSAVSSTSTSTASAEHEHD